MSSSNNPVTGEKRQRSIADMFGFKNSSSSTNSNNTNSNTNSSKNSSLKKPQPTSSKTNKNSSSSSLNNSSLKLNGSLTRVSYQNLKKIDKKSFYESLSAEFKTLLELELDSDFGLGESYLSVLRHQLTQQYFLDLKRFLLDQGLGQPKSYIYPAQKNIYLWSRVTPLDQIKVVIIGQDPYHGPGQAHGLCFSVPRGIPIPGSLRNIHEELKREYPEFKKPSHGSLVSWAQSGVLLLNTSLTVKKAQAGSHSNKGWEQFTDSIVEAIDLYGGLQLLSIEKTKKDDDNDKEQETKKKVEDDEKEEKLDDENDRDKDDEKKKDEDEENKENEGDDNGSGRSEKRIKLDPNALKSDQKKDDGENDKKKSNESLKIDSKNAPPGFGKGVVFLCWGKWAADRVAKLSTTKHLILKSAHPSPLSAHRGFLGNEHFKKANDWLESRYGEGSKIDWCNLKPELS